MARRKAGKQFLEMAIVSPFSDKCIVKVSIEKREVIESRIDELWMSEGYTSTEFKKEAPKKQKYPLDTMTLEDAVELHSKKGMLIHCSSGHVLGIYRENAKKGVKLYEQEKIRACV